MKRKCRSPTEAETENLIYTDKKRRGKNMELKNRKKKEQLPSSEKNMAGLKKRVVLLTGMGVLAVCLVTAGLVKDVEAKLLQLRAWRKYSNSIWRKRETHLMR